MGCNFSDTKWEPDLTMMADVKPILKLYQGVSLPCPAIISERSSAFIAGKTMKLSKERLTIHKVVPWQKRKSIHEKWGFNSAQFGVWYGIEEWPDTTEVHLWGCDSLWSTNIESSTDEIVHKDLKFMNSQNIYMVWREYWDYIFSEFPNITFYVHGPEKPDLKEASNLIWSKTHDEMVRTRDSD